MGLTHLAHPTQTFWRRRRDALWPKSRPAVSRSTQRTPKKDCRKQWSLSGSSLRDRDDQTYSRTRPVAPYRFRHLETDLPKKTLQRYFRHLVFVFFLYFSLYRSYYHLLTPLFKKASLNLDLPQGYVATLRTVWKCLTHWVHWRVPQPT